MSRPTHIELAGRDRLVLPGCLKYRSPPPPGTVLGPIYTGELVVVLDTIDGNTYLSYAQADDVAKSEESGRVKNEDSSLHYLYSDHCR